MNKLSVKNLEVKGKKVLCRVDYNCPMEGGKVRDNKRIVASLPTVKHVLENGGKLILMSHLGRPKGQPNPEFSLKPVAEELSSLIGKPVEFAPDCIGEEAKSKAESLGEGEVLVLENVRFYKEETDNDSAFSEKLAALGEVYINDAFGSAHRAHASTEGVTKFFDQCACGFLMEKELEFLGNAVANPARPFVAILGGAKVADKIPVIKNLLEKVDKIIIGGGMAYTFYKARGNEIGDSLLDEASLDFAEEVMNNHSDKILLPVDTLVTDKLDFDNKCLGETKIVASDSIPANWGGVDIGPKSIELISKTLEEAKTVVWNGPMGVFEIEASSKGTFSVAEALAAATDKGTVSIIGGGDSASAVKKAGLSNRMSHVSTGGGASLEFLEGKVLPGVDALTDA